ncbi:SPFH domain-containing protein [Kytococcus sp. Marseille-QA3725]
MPGAIAVVIGLLLLFVVVALARAIKIVPQATSVIVERLGRYNKTLQAGLNVLIPFIDKPRATVDLREQVVSFPPQPVITSDNLVVSIDTVIYFQVTDPKAATYEIANYISGIEQLTVTTLRNVIGSLDLEQTLTSRDQINGRLRGVLDEATGRWGIRVNRVELKAIDPPPSVQDSMEKQMRAERDRRAAILNAEGIKQSQILTAEGEKQAAILTAEGDAQSSVLRAQGESRAIMQVFDAIHRGNPNSKVFAYQYLQALPEISKGEANKMFFFPSEITDALKGVGGVLGGQPGMDGNRSSVHKANTQGEAMDLDIEETALEDPAEALRKARAEAAGATDEAADSNTPRRGSASGMGGLGGSTPAGKAPVQSDPGLDTGSADSRTQQLPQQNSPMREDQPTREIPHRDQPGDQGGTPPRG